MAAAHLHRGTEQAAPVGWAGAGSIACSPASSLCFCDHITPNIATGGYNAAFHCPTANRPLPLSTGELSESDREISLLFRGGKLQETFLVCTPTCWFVPFKHSTTEESSPKINARLWVVSLLKTGLILPWEPGCDGLLPSPSERPWGLPCCYPAFPWDVSVHGIMFKGKEYSPLAFLNTNNDFRGRKRTIRYCYVVPHLSLALKYLRSPMNNAASAPSLFCTSH